MSVQAAIALLNKNASSTTSSTATAIINRPSIASSWKANNVTTAVTPPVDNDKKTDVKQVRTRTQSGGVASILSKFDQQPSPVTSSTSTATTHTDTITSSSPSNDSNNNKNNYTTSIVASNNNTKTSSNCNFAALAKASPQSSSISNIMTLTTEEPTTSTSTSALTTKPAIIATPSLSTSTATRKPTKVGRQRSATVSAQVAKITRRSRSASVRDRAATINRTVVADTIGHELLAIYQDALNKLQAAEEEIEKLNQQKQQDTISTTSNSNENNNNNVSEDKKMSSQLRDYEIRIQYLSEKLDQLSQEHNLLERQLDQERKQQRMNSKRITLDTPISPEFRPFSKVFDTTNTTTTATSTTTGDELDRRRITVETSLTSENGEFWNYVLDGYEEKKAFFSSVNTSITTDEEDNNSNNINKAINSVSAALSKDENFNNKEQQQQLVLAELLFVKKQLTAVEKGAQIMLERHLRDLEKERQQTRTLTEVVHKQDQLIASLEVRVCPIENVYYCSEKENKDDDDSNNSSNNQHLLLQEQVELQRIELEDKRGLLTRLLDEREELLRQVMNHNSNKSLPISGIRSRSASVRSSIDVLSEMSKDNPIANTSNKHPLSRASSSSLLQISPRSSLGSHGAGLAHGRSTPPPTGPPKNPLPPLPPRGSSSMHSILSSATSWSSADYAAATGRYSGNNQQPSQQQQQQQHELVNSTSCKESSQPSNTVMMESSLPPHPSTFLHHYSLQQEQPVWLDYQSNEKKQQQLQEQQSPQPQPQTSSTINRSQTIKLKKSYSSGNSTFWKGWKHRLGSR